MAKVFRDNSLLSHRLSLWSYWAGNTPWELLHSLALLQNSTIAPFTMLQTLFSWINVDPFLRCSNFQILNVFSKVNRICFFKRLDILIVFLFSNGSISKYQNLWGSLAQQFKLLCTLSSTAMQEKIFSYEEC